MILTLKNINSGYDDAQVLFDVSLTVEAGSCVSLMGRNGMGKTTTVRTIMGQLPVKSVQIIRRENVTIALHHSKSLEQE